MGQFFNTNRLVKFWPWSVIAVERLNVDNWTRTAIGHVGTIGALERQLDAEEDLHIRLELDLEKENKELSRAVDFFKAENEALRAKLTRKGIKHKKIRARKTTTSVYI